ncbi:DUF421 domain-containing protein [Aciduricibacillus chroicocephali]|uniref:DUF421 domain-containing protein n=1 Tax=Aciduricibacillus chroicocephali TaxID=3054939 RepID=A0ABY9KXW3_9BACI|nr:DUF421 domain-containing protein [Bacillaceae bacterium 44XB]
MQFYLSMIYEMVFGFFALLIFAKIMGKTQISQITTFDFISALVLGDLIGNALFDKNTGIIEIALVIFIWSVLMYGTEMITQKFNRSRSFLEGRPAIIIQRGELIRDSMRKNKLDINQLQHLLRAKNAFTVSEVHSAILETDGTLSVLKKSDFQMADRQDHNLVPKPVRLPMTLVIDGAIIHDNLNEMGRNEKWLMQKLKEQGFTRVKDVFYAEWTPDQKLLAQDGKGLNKDESDHAAE